MRKDFCQFLLTDLMFVYDLNLKHKNRRKKRK